MKNTHKKIIKIKNINIKTDYQAVLQLLLVVPSWLLADMQLSTSHLQIYSKDSFNHIEPQLWMHSIYLK